MSTNPKGDLQELLQKSGRCLPEYSELPSLAAGLFRTAVTVQWDDGATLTEEGTGRKKKDAEVAAASRMLELLRVNLDMISPFARVGGASPGGSLSGMSVYSRGVGVDSPHTPSRLGGASPFRLGGTSPLRLGGASPLTPLRLGGASPLTPLRLGGASPLRLGGASPLTPPRLGGASPPNIKGSLQELLQKYGHPFPQYELVSKTGSGSDVTHTVKCTVVTHDRRLIAQEFGNGRKKIEAEKDAAEKLYPIVREKLETGLSNCVLRQVAMDTTPPPEITDPEVDQDINHQLQRYDPQEFYERGEDNRWLCLLSARKASTDGIEHIPVTACGMGDTMSQAYRAAACNICVNLGELEYI